MPALGSEAKKRSSHRPRNTTVDSYGGRRFTSFHWASRLFQIEPWRLQEALAQIGRNDLPGSGEFRRVPTKCQVFNRKGKDTPRKPPTSLCVLLHVLLIPPFQIFCCFYALQATPITTLSAFQISSLLKSRDGAVRAHLSRAAVPTSCRFNGRARCRDRGELILLASRAQLRAPRLFASLTSAPDKLPEKKNSNTRWRPKGCLYLTSVLLC